MDRLPAIRRVILADRSPWASSGYSATAVVIPTVLRWSIDGGEDPMIPFVTYYPAVVLAALLLGWRWGALVALASGIVVNRVFLPEPMMMDLSVHETILVGLFVVSCAALVAISETARRLVRQLEATKEREALLNRELSHRVQNMVATVSAMAVLTARHSEPDELASALAGRLETLKRTTELLETGVDAQCELHSLLDTVLAPFRSEGNFSVVGPACELPEDSCVPLALALHELATNAAKYGALTVPEGRVTLLWTLGEEGPDLLRLIWQEEDGPTVEQPSRQGMGTQLLKRQRGLDAVEVEYRPDGVRCDLQVSGVKPISRET